jgi:hypothetical protein
VRLPRCQRVYIIDVSNLVITDVLKDLGQDSGRERYGEALVWLKQYCAELLADQHQAYFLVQDNRYRTNWFKQANGLYFVSITDADAAIILLARCFADGRPMDNLLASARGVTVAPSAFPREEFGEYVARMVQAAAAIQGYHSHIVASWKEAIRGSAEIVVITRDVNLREACRLAGAIVDGPAVNEWYQDLTDAWRQQESRTMPHEGEEEVSTMATVDRREANQVVDVMIDADYLEFERFTDRGATYQLRVSGARHYNRIFENRDAQLDAYRPSAAIRADLDEARGRLDELQAAARTIERVGATVPSEAMAAIEGAKAEVAEKEAAALAVTSPSAVAATIKGRALFVSQLNKSGVVQFFLNDVPADRQDDDVVPLWVLAVPAPARRRVVLAKARWFFPLDRGADVAGFVIAGDMVQYHTTSTDETTVYANGMAVVSAEGEIVHIESPIGGNDGVELYRPVPARETSMQRALANAKPLTGNGGNGNGQRHTGDDSEDPATDPTRAISTTAAADGKETAVEADSESAEPVPEAAEPVGV